MSFFERFQSEMVGLFVESAPYLLVGFLLAGLLKVFLPKRFVESQLGGNDLRSIFRAALYGLPLPLCSCSVLPTAASLRKAGASRGATTSFLISTPETGVDSISVTYALFDPVMTIVRPLAAFMTAIVTGFLVTLGVREEPPPPEDLDEVLPDEVDHVHEHGCDANALDWDTARFDQYAPLERLKLAVRYAFGPLLDDLTPWFVIGFLLSGLVAALVPETFFTETVPGGWASMLLMVLIGTPLYICATASTPIAAALVAKGLDPGAALVFLLVGPATNVTTLLVVSRLLGRRTVLFYLVGIVVFALFAGLVVNALYLGLAIDLSAVVAQGLAEPSHAIGQVAALIFAALMLRSAWKIRFWKWAGDGLSRFLKPIGVDPGTTGWRALGVAALVAWVAASSTTWIGYGETGWLLRFGQVVERLDEPGLHVHWPWPITRAEFVTPESVRRYEFGFRSDESNLVGALFPEQFAHEERLAAESLILTGDDPPALLDIEYVAQFALADPTLARFGVRDLDALARNLAEEAMRRTIGSMPALDALYRDQASIVPTVERQLAGSLEGTGLALISVELRDLHAPAKVHSAYRGVASAEEESETTLHEAHANVTTLGATVRTSTANLLLEARMEAHRIREHALARRDAFLARAEADAKNPELTRRALEQQLFRQIVRDLQLVVVSVPGLELELYDLRAGRLPAVPNFSDFGAVGDPLQALGPKGQH
ncbi:MAG: SO_0444 family Cu/Zn efflux transporter [Planctomycetota bacterium]